MTLPLTPDEIERLFPFRPLPGFVSPDLVLRTASATLLPPRRVRVSEAAARSMMISRPDYQGPFRLDKAPYMVEAMDCIRDRAYEAVVFAGPAQSLKTSALVEGSFVHAVTCDPLDMLIVQMSQSAARDFSQNRLDKLIRCSPDVRDRLTGARSADNVYDKRFAGMLLRIAWPAPTELSSKSVPLVVFTDYDRMPADVGGEGSPFELGRARTRTFGSLGKVVAESSPKARYQGAWHPRGHEAPPVNGGILSLYNRGDMRRLYWPCPECGEYFEAHFRYLDWPKSPSGTPEDGIDAAAARTVMVCPHCGALTAESGRRALLARSVWLRDGETITAAGVRGGSPRAAAIASFWLNGAAACDQSWCGLVRSWLHARAQAERSGNDDELMAVVNLHIGDCHVVEPVDGGDAIDAQAVRARAEPGWGLGTVPDGVRALVATVDVQGRYFDVQITGYGRDLESWVVDRWQIAQHPGESRMLDPGAYAEDWSLLTPILSRSWPLVRDPDRGMRVLTMVVDSGGAPGVTGNAYSWLLAARAQGHSEQRLMLLKGDTRVGPRRVSINRIDFTQGGRTLARGRKIMMVGTDALKDDVAAALRRSEPGPGYLHTPADLPEEWYGQVAAESRDDRGRWHKRAERNEALDHLTYSRAAILRPPFRADAVGWDNPPPFWADFDANPLVHPLSGAPAPVAAIPATAAQPSPAPPPPGPRFRPGGGGRLWSRR